MLTLACGYCLASQPLSQSKTEGLVTACASVTCMRFGANAYFYTADSNFCERGWSARLYKLSFATISCAYLLVHTADRRALYIFV